MTEPNMGKFGTYRYLELKEENSTPHITSRSRPIKHGRRLKKVFLVVLVLGLLGLFAGQTQWLDGLAKTLGYESVHHYAIIIDAGSSGTRVLAYKFRVPFTIFGPANLDLVDEFWKQVKPGLSSYAKDPEAGAQTIVQLIKDAEYLIPQEKRKDTPLLVKATAGLRLLPPEHAQNLLNHVTDAISKLGYDVGSNAVEIMNGSDEGIFIWYTVNLLHNLLGQETTMAALDLGGGSTQITFQIDDADSNLYPAGDQYVLPVGRNITIFTHSFLNLGLLASRYGVFRMEASSTSNKFTSVCVDTIVKDEQWKYGNVLYTVSGADRKGLTRKAVYKRCHDLVLKYVQATLDFQPQQAPRGNVAAMSYFYDVAADAGIIDVMKGGTVKVSQYRAEALRACSAFNVDQPWACIDLVYIVTLLQDVYKMGDSSEVSLYKKIDGHEVSWGLGLAYTTVTNKLVAAAKAAA